MIVQQTYTPTEVAEVLQVGRSTVYRQIRKGELPHRHIGKIIRVPIRQFNQYLEGDWVPRPCEECTPKDAPVRHLRKAL